VYSFAVTIKAMQLFQPPPSPSHHHQFSTHMSSPDFPSGRSPRQQLQGPRPAPLKVRKDSHKIKKPPIAPSTQHQLQQQQQQQHRAPVIIYTVSPKVIHTNPDDFRTLVQRLTGSSSSSSVSENNSGGVSPAARFASLEKTKSPKGKLQQNDEANIVQGVNMDMDMDLDLDMDISIGFPGILSPAPNSLPYIPPNFFSPPSDQNSNFGFFDLSPVLHTSRSYLDGSFMPSPSSFLYSQITSPTQPLDIFNNLFD
jgi:hypothetical protein